jgi:hypothetical protein
MSENSRSEMMRRKPSFSIEDILSPNFGSCSELKSSSLDQKQKPFGNIALDQKQKSFGNIETPTIKASTLKVSKNPFKAGEVLSDSSFVPAWIFSTRYSDRPASGKIFLT